MKKTGNNTQARSDKYFLVIRKSVSYLHFLWFATIDRSASLKTSP